VCRRRRDSRNEGSDLRRAIHLSARSSRGTVRTCRLLMATRQCPTLGQSSWCVHASCDRPVSGRAEVSTYRYPRRPAPPGRPLPDDSHQLCRFAQVCLFARSRCSASPRRKRLEHSGTTPVTAVPPLRRRLGTPRSSYSPDGRSNSGRRPTGLNPWSACSTRLSLGREDRAA
jgi:hypothetical protein